MSITQLMILAGGGTSAPDGSSSSRAGVSAAQILSDYPNSTDGVYWIDLPTVGPTLDQLKSIV